MHHSGDTPEVASDHLRNRVEEAKRWADDEFPGTAFDRFREQFRGHIYEIRPYEFVDNGNSSNGKPHQQRFGIRFSVKLVSGPTFVSYVDVLVCPEWKGAPRIKVKAVNLDDGHDVKSARDIISPKVVTGDCKSDDAIDVFFKEWLRRAFTKEHDKAEKIIDFKYPLTPTEDF